MELSTQDPSSTPSLSGTSFNNKNNQDSANTFNNVGNALKRDGDMQGAYEAYKQALNIEPNCAETYDNIGAAFMEIGNTEVAIAAYQQALNIEPDNIKMINNLNEAVKLKSK